MVFSDGKKNYWLKDDDYKIKPLHIMLLIVRAYVKSFDGEAKQIYFSIEDNELQNYSGIWNKVRIIKKELDCRPIYNKKFLKTKIRSYGSKVTDYHDKEIPKVGSNYICLAVILLDFVLK